VKGSVVGELTPILRKYVGPFLCSHPMAGSEKTGVQAARPDLFDHTVCAVTPSSSNEQTDIDRLSQFWEALGTKTIVLSPQLHDVLVGRTSHLPHIIASQLVNAVLEPGPNIRQQACLCGSGFRDTTRIASGSPEMWRDIALANQQNLTAILRAFADDLEHFIQLLQKTDDDGLLDFFTTARDRRDAWLDEREDLKSL
jgi:prephenate dehydrogenase